VHGDHKLNGGAGTACLADAAQAFHEEQVKELPVLFEAEGGEVF
jgi:hypothetical protein